MQEKLCLRFNSVQKKANSTKGPKEYAKVDIVDLLCDYTEHSTLQLFVNDKVLNYSDYYLYYTWNLSNRTKEE
eukprot:11976185-Ditylum_brightwellii.AAC.1